MKLATQGDYEREINMLRVALGYYARADIYKPCGNGKVPVLHEGGALARMSLKHAPGAAVPAEGAAPKPCPDMVSCHAFNGCLGYCKDSPTKDTR